jgi:hypothetical protein
VREGGKERGREEGKKESRKTTLQRYFELVWLHVHLYEGGVDIK